MKIYIEVLIPLLIALLVGLWFLWLKLSKRWHNWRYKPENDRGKKGEEHRQELIRAGNPDPASAIAKAYSNSGGQGEPKGRSDVQTTDALDVREDSTGSGKRNGRKFFGRFRKKG